jgi:hypothetical protein
MHLYQCAKAAQPTLRRVPYIDQLAMAAMSAEDDRELRAVLTDGAVKSMGVSSAAARQVGKWANTAAHLQCSNCVSNMSQRSAVLAGDTSSSSGQQIPAAAVQQAGTVYLQLFVQLQLLVATLFEQQQQQQQGDARDDSHGIWLDMLRHHNILFRRYIRAVTQIKLPEDVLGIQQLLNGPDAPLLRALAAPLTVAEVWHAEDDQLRDSVGDPGEQLFALRACLEAAASSTEAGE